MRTSRLTSTDGIAVEMNPYDRATWWAENVPIVAEKHHEHRCAGQQDARQRLHCSGDQAERSIGDENDAGGNRHGRGIRAVEELCVTDAPVQGMA